MVSLMRRPAVGSRRGAWRLSIAGCVSWGAFHALQPHIAYEFLVSSEIFKRAPSRTVACASKAAGIKDCVAGDTEADSRQLFVLDFDHTIARIHMWETYDDAALDDIPVNDKTFVDIEAFQELVGEARAYGHEVAIATFGRRDVVEKTLCHALGEFHGICIDTPEDHSGRYKNIQMAGGAILTPDKSEENNELAALAEWHMDCHKAFGDKNIQLAALAKRFHVAAGQILLLDDQLQNVQRAIRVGITARHVPHGLTRRVVVQLIDDFVAKGTNRPNTQKAAREAAEQLSQYARPWKDHRKWVTLSEHTYNTLLQDRAQTGYGKYARVMVVVLQKGLLSGVLRMLRVLPEQFARIARFGVGCLSARVFKKVAPIVGPRDLEVSPRKDEDSECYAWKSYVASIEGLLEGDLEESSHERDARQQCRVIRQLARRGLLPHSLMPADLSPTITILHAGAPKAGDTMCPISKVRGGLIFPMMDGDARNWVSDKADAAVHSSFGKSMLEALIALRKAGYVHADFKLDNVLYKGDQKPIWFLNDFDLMTKIGDPGVESPPMRDLVARGLRSGLRQPTTGAEDFYCFIVAYAELDKTTTAEELAQAFAFVSGSGSAMEDFDPSKFPKLGKFSPASFQW